MMLTRVHNDWPLSFSVDEATLAKALAAFGITDARLYCDPYIPVVYLKAARTTAATTLRPEAALGAARALQSLLGQPVVVLQLEPCAIKLTFKNGGFLGYTGDLEDQGALLDELAIAWRMAPSQPRDMKLTSTAEKADAWDAIERILDELSPGWCDPGRGIRPVAEAATHTLRSMASAAEWGEMSTMRQHLNGEMAAVQGMLQQPDIPENLARSLRAHLQRLGRI